MGRGRDYFWCHFCLSLALIAGSAWTRQPLSSSLHPPKVQFFLPRNEIPSLIIILGIGQTSRDTAKFSSLSLPQLTNCHFAASRGIISPFGARLLPLNLCKIPSAPQCYFLQFSDMGSPAGCFTKPPMREGAHFSRKYLRKSP